ncbi:MAG: hypothetical protein CMM31_05515, partial [Rhodospirillaceae bacterium]|nr:hypothetical protein [Rhodospirillaceae bacterium]
MKMDFCGMARRSMEVGASEVEAKGPPLTLVRADAGAGEAFIGQGEQAHIGIGTVLPPYNWSTHLAIFYEYVEV